MGLPQYGQVVISVPTGMPHVSQVTWSLLSFLFTALGLKHMVVPLPSRAAITGLPRASCQSTQSFALYAIVRAPYYFVSKFRPFCCRYRSGAPSSPRASRSSASTRLSDKAPFHESNPNLQGISPVRSASPRGILIGLLFWTVSRLAGVPGPGCAPRRGLGCWGCYGNGSEWHRGFRVQ